MRAILGRYNIGKTKILIGLILLIAIAATLFLVQQQQNVRSRANVNPNAFEVRNDQGQRLECDTNGICQTDTLRVRIKLTDPDKLSQ